MVSIPTPFAAVVSLAVAYAGLLFFTKRRLAGSTLMGPWYWVGVSLAAITGAEFLVAGTVFGGGDGGKPAWSEPIRYIAAMSTLCPTMAVLGAKRPQDRGWQWVVLSLWITLSLPCGHWLLARSSGPMAIFFAWKLFVVGLILLGLLNYLPTRHALSALLVAAGQGSLLENHLPWLPFPLGDWRIVTAMAFFFAGLSWACFRTVRSETVSTNRDTSPIEEALAPRNKDWLHFRDAYGSFWALRILGRVNETAQICRWPVCLQWHGFAPSAPDENPQPSLTEKQKEEIHRTLRTLLRRFVKAEG